MLIIGAKGFAKEVLEVCHQLGTLESVIFYDDVSKDLADCLYGKFKIIRSEEELFEKRETYEITKFTLGVGNPSYRYTLANKFESKGLELVSVISPFAHLGNYDVFVDKGVNCMTGTVITNSIQIGKGCLINLNCTIGHDSILGRFVELSPGVHISGNCEIGDFVTVGTNVSILPSIKIGSNSIIGAGAVVTKNIPANSLAIGVPAKVIKRI
jgi:sugar O-acyltransferase (sialic acid O-acetyltransferase NeuD family)